MQEIIIKDVKLKVSKMRDIDTYKFNNINLKKVDKVYENLCSKYAGVRCFFIDHFEEDNYNGYFYCCN